jgi:hypothetical protein
MMSHQLWIYRIDLHILEWNQQSPQVLYSAIFEEPCCGYDLKLVAQLNYEAIHHHDSYVHPTKVHV